MANYTEEVVDDVRIYEPHYTMEIRKTTITKKDGVEVGRTHYRHCKVPGDDVSQSGLTKLGIGGDYSKFVEDNATKYWTKEVVDAYEKDQQEQFDKARGG
jgi:hypothetical protein